MGLYVVPHFKNEKRGVFLLRNIPKILPPDLVKNMMEMGHSDFLVIADANFPGKAHAKKIIRMDGIMIPDLLDAILKVFPLDNFIEYPVKLMKNLPTEPTPKAWEIYRKLLKKYDIDSAFSEFEFLERLSFYQYTASAYMVIQTGDEARYGNIILQKGVC